MAEHEPQEAVPVVEYGGRQFSMPFVDLLPKQSQEVIDGLEASIKEDGILLPVVVNQDDTFIDGQTRFALAVKHGIPIEQIPFKVISADWPKCEELAITLNYARRKMTPEQRASLVGVLRVKGWSVRRIAKALQVSSTQIHYDIHGKPPAKPAGSPPSETPMPAGQTADEAPNATGDIEADWGLTGESDGDDGPVVPGDDLKAAAQSGVTAVGQLSRSLQRLGEMTDERQKWLQAIFTVLRERAGLKEAA